MADETSFLEVIAQDPRDITTRLVYADWLDDVGDRESSRRAEFLRLTVQLTTDTAPAAGTLERIRQLAVGRDAQWLEAISGAPLLVLEHVGHNGLVTTANLVRYQLRGGCVRGRDIVYSSDWRMFGSAHRPRLVGSRFVVTAYGGIVDIRDRNVIHDERLGTLLAVEGNRVIFRMDNAHRENGVFEFDLESRQLRRVEGPSKWDLPGVRSPDDLRSVQGHGLEVRLHQIGQEPKVVASNCHVRLSRYSSYSMMRVLPLAWLDDTRFVTQTANGVLVEVNLDGAMTPFLTVPVGEPPISRLRLDRDLLGQLSYTYGGDIYALDAERRSYSEYKWMPLGHGFDCEYAQNKEYGRVIRYKGQEIGRLWCNPWKPATDPGRLAVVGGAVRSGQGVMVWTAWTGTWVTIDVPVDAVIGWVVPGAPRA